jgi:hypothetical protein
VTDLVVAERAAVQALHRNVTAYARSLQTITSALRVEVRAIEQASQVAVERHRHRLRQADVEVERAADALRRCGDERRRRECEEAVRAAQRNAAVARQSYEEAHTAETRVAAALHELMRAVFVVESAVADQSSAARSALLELEEKLKSITGARALSDADRTALSDITGLGHQRLNRSLSKGSMEDVAAVGGRVNAVSRALEKLPVHEGTGHSAARLGRKSHRGPDC